MPIADDAWFTNVTINHISCELERTHLARSPQLLQELNNIKESCDEMGHVEFFRLKQYHNGDV
ncbi:uncharacterized protein LOC116805057 [Drosophila grimshawi]|uniref:uncharacterized protein LOC116805057 n=1 Tax=Drosophila grimshawi TaxID=7222 RepID=UPI000C86E9FC|nr:uncharacterized protein LOC116805057 [Drosophila grimshawi]